MSYRTWTTDGYGICVDDIGTTTAGRLLDLAALKPKVYEDVIKYLDQYFEGEGGYNEEDLILDDFEELEGDYGERGVAYILFHVIDEIDVVFADDYNGVSYILYCPKYPWNINEEEKDLTREDIRNIFDKYVSILTNRHVAVTYYSVENGG